MPGKCFLLFLSSSSRSTHGSLFRQGGATKRRTTPVPKQMTETVATCKVSVSWPSYWLNDITRYRDQSAKSRARDTACWFSNGGTEDPSTTSVKTLAWFSISALSLSGERVITVGDLFCLFSSDSDDC